MFETLSHSQVRSLALATVTAFDELAGERWVYYPLDVLQHWQPSDSLLETVQNLRQAGDHTLAVLLADAGGVDDEQASATALSPSPAHRLSRREMAYRLRQIDCNWNVQDAVRCFWNERASIETIVARMQRAGQQKLAEAFERELLLFCETDTPRPLPELPRPPLLPRLLEPEEAQAVARRIVYELSRVDVNCTQAEVLAFWQADWPILSIDLLMREAGEQVMALLFEEFVLYGAEATAVLQTRRPCLQDTLSERDAQRIARVVKDCVGRDIWAVWEPGQTIEALNQRVSDRYGRRVADDLLYWTLRHPGYDTWPVGEEPILPGMPVAVPLG
jgi:hypothetical protein